MALTEGNVRVVAVTGNNDYIQVWLMVPNHLV